MLAFFFINWELLNVLGYINSKIAMFPTYWWLLVYVINVVISIYTINKVGMENEMGYFLIGFITSSLP